MSDFKVHTVETAPNDSRELLAALTKKYGFTANLHGVMAEAPAMLKAYTDIYDTFEKTSLRPPEQQIVLLATSYINHCHYCMAAHSVVAAMQKVPDDTIEALRNGTALNDPKLEALRHFTTTIVEKQGWASDEDVEAFLSAGYTKAQLMEVIVGIATKTLSNYLNHLSHTPVDKAFEKRKWER